MRSVDPLTPFDDLYCVHNIRRDGSDGTCPGCHPSTAPQKPHKPRNPATRRNGDRAGSSANSSNSRNSDGNPDIAAQEGSAGSAVSAGGWEPPSPLGAVAGPPFPIATLPNWLAAHAAETARALQVPVDLPACLSLAGLATAAGGRARIAVRPGWTEPVNLYVAVVLPPGERKSPAFRAVTAPITAAEHALVAKVKPMITEAETKRDIADGQARRAATAAAKPGKDGDPAQLAAAAIEAAQAAEEITVPSLPRLLADDASPEALTSLLADHGRISVLSDEGDVFDTMAGRWQQTPNLAPYLKGWDGGAMRVDRKGRGPEYVERPALTLGLAIQPAVLRALQDQPGFRGRGLLARVLWSLPESRVGFRDPDPDPPDPDTIATFDRALRHLVETFADTEPAVLTMTADAADVLTAWATELEPRMRPDDDLAPVRDWAAKLVGTTARLAGLLHIAEHAEGDWWSSPVTAATVEHAVTLARYWLAHALVAFQVMGADQALDLARAVAGWVSDRSSFTRREIFNDHRSKFPRAADVDPVLARLEEHGWIRRCPDPDRTGKRGRPPAPTFDVNPAMRNQRKEPQP